MKNPLTTDNTIVIGKSDEVQRLFLNRANLDMDLLQELLARVRR